MQKPNITPGPWNAGINEGEVFDESCTKRIVDNTTCPTECPRSLYGQKEREANAQAIAALPDLLGALEAEEAWRALTPADEDFGELRAKATTLRRAAMIKAGYTF